MSSLLGEYAGGAKAGPDAFELIAVLERLNEELNAANRELEQRVQTLERLVFMDPLTGLGNRRYFDAVLGSELRRALRSRSPLTLLLCDIDRFRRLNERHGRAAGDALLAEIAGLLRRACRRGGDRPLRYGGDEFALLLPDTDAATAAAFAAVLRREVAALRLPAADGAAVTLGVGASTYAATELCTPNRLVRSACEALRRAQAAGGDCTVVAH